MVYLDNAATTARKPESVYRAHDQALRFFSANPGRSGHKAALEAGERVLHARETLAGYFHTSMERVIFTFGCTDALNIVLQGVLRPGDHVLASVFEHNSVLRPLYARKDISCTFVLPDVSGHLQPEALKKSLQPGTRLLVTNYVSNVTGVRQDMAALAAFCKENGLLFLADCAQAAGVFPVDMRLFDYAALAGHKGLYGPQGVGVLLLSEDAPLPRPLRFGGTGSRSLEQEQPPEMPDLLESGTLPTAAICALEAGADAVLPHREALLKHELLLADRLMAGLRELPGVNILSPKKAESGVVSFNLPGMESQRAAALLDERFDIAVRGGYHCAPLVHKWLGTEENGAVRMSMGMFNTAAEIDFALCCVEKILFEP